MGRENGARIGELGDLNLLGCSLELKVLENVRGIGMPRVPVSNTKQISYLLY